MKTMLIVIALVLANSFAQGQVKNNPRQTADFADRYLKLVRGQYIELWLDGTNSHSGSKIITIYEIIFASYWLSSKRINFHYDSPIEVVDGMGITLWTNSMLLDSITHRETPIAAGVELYDYDYNLEYLIDDFDFTYRQVTKDSIVVVVRTLKSSNL